MAINRGSVSDTVGAVSAATSEQNALTHANDASTSATAAANSAAAAASSESNASSSSSTASSASATAVAAKDTATTQASNASTSATAASDSATAAAASAASIPSVGISEDNILQVNATVSDNDYLKIDGQKAEGRSASEVLGDIGAQAADADLTAIAGLTSAADKGIQFTGSGTAGTYDLTAAGKALLDDANASAQRTTLGLGTASTLDTGISNTNVAKFTSGVADSDFLKVNGTSIEGRSASEVLSDIGGQAADADLTAIAGLTSAADKGIQFTGSGSAGTYDLTTAGKALLDDADASAQRTTLGLGTASVLDTGISNTNVPKFTSGVATGDFLKVNGTEIEGRSASEVLSDIGAQGVAGSNLVVPDGGTIGSASDTDAITIASDGKVTMAEVATVSKGIKFTGTVASTDSNTLDSYEEGTWTPVVTGTSTAGTYEPDGTFNKGFYQKIGRMVTVRGISMLASSITGGGSGNMQIGGLPFNYDASHNCSAGAVVTDSVDFSDSAIDNRNIFGLGINANSGSDASTLRLLLSRDNSGFYTRAIADVDPLDFIEFTYTYATTA